MRTTGFDMCDVDLLDEEYLGPPPRFLVENNPRDFIDADAELIAHGVDDSSPIGLLKTFFGSR